MADSRFSEIISNLSEKIQDSPAFVQLKAKWDEQDHRTKTTMKYAGLGGSALLLVIIVGGSFASVSAKRDELDEKLMLVRKIQSAQDELRRLRSVTSAPGLSESGEWAPYVKGEATNAGIADTAVNVTEKKAPPSKASSETAPEETLITIDIAKVNIKQLVKYVYQLENGPRTAKVRSLQVDTLPDESGYLDVKLAVSGFTLTRTE